MGLPILGALAAKITTDIWANPRKFYFRTLLAGYCAWLGYKTAKRYDNYT